MDNRYLNIFEGLFFKVDDNSEVKNIIEQASYVLSSIIIKFGEVENELCCGTSRKDNYIDIFLSIFIRKIMEQIDAINVLFSIGSFAQSQIILRSLIENIVSLQFILKEDTPKRAAAYFLEHHYQEIEIGDDRVFNKESDFSKQIIANKGQEAFEIDRNKFLKKKEAFERFIKSKPVFQEVKKEREKKKEKKKHIKWYTVCSNVTTIKELMKEIGYDEKCYDNIYGGLSYETHAYNSTMDISFDEKGICLKPIRNPVDGSTALSLTCTFCIGLLRKIYEYLGDGEEEQKEFIEFFVDFRNKRDIACQNLDKIK